MVHYSLFTHKSAYKENTEDAVFADGVATQSNDYEHTGEAHPDCTAFAVFDGVSGSADGALASRTCAEAFEKLFCKKTFSSALDVMDALEQLQKRTLEAQAEAERTAQTTVVAALLQKECVWILNVGDSPLFLEANGYFEEITTKDSYLALLQKENGFVSDAQKEQHAHRLSHAIGAKSFDKHRAHVYRFDRKPGLRLFLMSDGVSDYFPKSKLAALSKNKRELPALAAYIRAEVIRLGAEDDFSWISVEVTE